MEPASLGEDDVNRVRWAGLTLATLCCLVLTVACSAKKDLTSGDAVAELKAAAAKTDGQPFAFTVAVGTVVTGSGKQDGTGNAMSFDLNVSAPSSGLQVKANVLVISPDLWVKVDFGALAGAIPGLGPVGDKWMHVDASKVGSGAAFGIKPGKDLLSPSALISGVTTARRTSSTGYAGTIDLTKSTLPFAQQLGASAAPVPFTATVDSSGRVASIVITPPVSASTTGTVTLTYSGYGTPVNLQPPPAAQTVPAPDMIYQFLS
jgi:hypothetical protein